MTEFGAPDLVLAGLKVSSKKQLLQDLARHAASLTRLPESEIVDVLLTRERLGSTAMGDGIAIPHGKLPGLARLVGLFARLDKPVDFEAEDNRPVDLVFLLLAPPGAGADHLRALASVSRMLRDSDFCDKLRGAGSVDALAALLGSRADIRAA